PSAQSHEQPDHWVGAGDRSRAYRTISAITHLPSFDRIIFVMLVLERYSEWECALLLGCTTRDVQEARKCAMQQLAALYATTNPEDLRRATQELQREYQRSRP